MQNHNLKLKILTISFFMLLGFFGFAGGAEGAVVLQDDFEYGQDSSGHVETFALPGWKWSTTYNEARGTFGISSIHSHSGSRSMLMSFLAATYGGQTDVHVQANGDFGNDVWVDMWIYPAYEEGRYSRFNNLDKWIYAYSSLATSDHPWLALLGTSRNIIDADCSPYQNPLFPLPNDHTGLFWSFSASDSVNCFIGQNINDAYMPVNVWSRLITHIDNSNITSPNHNIEAWIDSGSGLIKVVEHNLTFAVVDQLPVVRIKIGTTFPGLGGDTNYLDAWIFVDDVKIATSRDDIGWSNHTMTVTLNAPSNSAFLNNQTVSFNCSAISANSLRNITLYGN